MMKFNTDNIFDLLYKIISSGIRLWCWLVYGFLVIPLVAVIPLSFSSDSYLNYPLPGMSLRWYAELINNPAWLDALKASIFIGALATALATSLGVLAAFGLRRLNARTSALINLLFIAPMIIPHVIYAVSAFIQFSEWGLSGGYTGLIIGHVALAVPMVIITVTAALQGFDWKLIRAAQSLGAAPLKTFWLIVFPCIFPGIVAGALFAFIVSFDEVIFTLFMSGPTQKTLPIQLFSSIRDEITPVVTSASTVMLIISAAALTTMEILRRRSDNKAMRSAH